MASRELKGSGGLSGVLEEILRSGRVSRVIDRRRAASYLGAIGWARREVPGLLDEVTATCRRFDREEIDPATADRGRLAALSDAARLTASAWAATAVPPRHRAAHELLGHSLWRGVEATSELRRAVSEVEHRRWFQAVVASQLACTATRMWESGWRQLESSLDEIGMADHLARVHAFPEVPDAAPSPVEAGDPVVDRRSPVATDAQILPFRPDRLPSRRVARHRR